MPASLCRLKMMLGGLVAFAPLRTQGAPEPQRCEREERWLTPGPEPNGRNGRVHEVFRVLELQHCQLILWALKYAFPGGGVMTSRFMHTGFVTIWARPGWCLGADEAA